MELNGEDKRIRALFCELKREEERTAPPFARTWNIAEAEFDRSGVRRLRFQSAANLLRFATAILVVSLVLAATVLLPKYLRLPRQPEHDHGEQAAAAAPRATSEDLPRSREVPNSESGKPIDRPLAIRRSVRVKKSPVASAQRAPLVKQDGLSGLSQWQSPTAKLLRSAGDELLWFVPPMNESAEEMKKFLANDLN
jgi:hypothetical protein